MTSTEYKGEAVELGEGLLVARGGEKRLKIVAKCVVTLALIGATIAAHIAGSGELSGAFMGTTATAVGFWFRDERNRETDQ